MAGRAIQITAGTVSVEARLNESRTAAAIWDALPIDARGDTWGDEIYFDIGLTAAPESPKDVVEPGDLGYWPPGRAFCIFFGPTPMSRGGEIRPASPVNVVGRIVGDPRIFKTVSAGARVTLRRGV
ncbi:MAG: cyclophilin-like fold protein [Candidatus Rokuibacteriota bacterium]